MIVTGIMLALSAVSSLIGKTSVAWMVVISALLGCQYLAKGSIPYGDCGGTSDIVTSVCVDIAIPFAFVPSLTGIFRAGRRTQDELPTKGRAEILRELRQGCALAGLIFAVLYVIWPNFLGHLP
ncbi:MAG: hypothetical protein HYR64_09370 [Fimbriimonas ginsengisoli]|uniref:Uncharacterized protein n=1 Tax=Fimbriimonas ginsengisoli TaxID=1005039 RepID=A0A931LYV8_FIMGI|nr:hypothetical protein [Fimbriimonas ginsengisoli]